MKCIHKHIKTPLYFPFFYILEEISSLGGASHLILSVAEVVSQSWELLCCFCRQTELISPHKQNDNKHKSRNYNVFQKSFGIRKGGSSNEMSVLV